VAQRRKSAFQISYVTITYRSVLMGTLAVMSVAAIVMYFTFPDTTNRLIMSGQLSLERLLTKAGFFNSHDDRQVNDPGPQQAHFINIDGVVRVKKASSNTWVTADYSLGLEKNDVVQTADEGIARVRFADGTNYTVKPDSLIVIQENSVNESQQAKVAVQVTTGTVDLTTASAMARGSKSQVIVEGATATFSPESAGEVQNDPRNDQHSILVKKGGAEVQRGREDVKIVENEKLAFTSDSPTMTKTKEIGPPVLMDPKSGDNVPLDPKSKGVTLTWSPVDGVHTFHVRVARNQFFTGPLVVDQNWTHLELVLANLGPGSYWWEVQSVSDSGKPSAASERNKFTVVPYAENGAKIPLEIVSLIQHGHVFEIKGQTEPGARVMVNGQEVAMINPDGSFHHFTNQLPTGENWITVTAQNSKGGYGLVSRPVNIQ
jgi:FecR protein